MNAPSSPTAPAPTSPPVPEGAGQSYWEIVGRQFSRNRLAVWSARVVLLLMLSAILAPLLANNLPYVFRGTMPGPYREQYDTLRFATRELEGIPEERARTQKQVDEGKTAWNALQPFLERETALEAHKVFEKHKRDFDSSIYQTQRFTMSDARAVVPAAEHAAIEAIQKMASGRVGPVFAERAERQRKAILLAIDTLAIQVAGGGGPDVAAARSEYRSFDIAAFARSAPEEASKEKARLTDLSAKGTAGLDPDRVTLTPRTWWPLLEQLTPGDFFFLILALMFLVVGPLVFRLLQFDRRYPYLGPRFKRKMAVLLVPPVLVAAIATFKQERLASLDYKEATRTGAVVPEYAYYPPFAYGINESHLERRFENPTKEHLLGTDGGGRDLLTRMLWGGRISLSVGFVSVSISLVIGLFFGMLAGYYRGAVDSVVMRLIEIVICFPSMFLLITIMAFVPPSVFNIMMVIGLTAWTGVARLIRGEFFRLRNQEFVLAAQALGVPDWRIIVRHILPNAIAPVLVAASFGIASAILVESSLSFLGFGITIPIPSWGGILNDARQNLHYWWLVWTPGFAIFLAVTTYNLVGDALRDAIDPRLKM